jgi:hypothetical protein
MTAPHQRKRLRLLFKPRFTQKIIMARGIDNNPLASLPFIYYNSMLDVLLWARILSYCYVAFSFSFRHQSSILEKAGALLDFFLLYCHGSYTYNGLRCYDGCDLLRKFSL